MLWNLRTRPLLPGPAHTFDFLNRVCGRTYGIPFYFLNQDLKVFGGSKTLVFVTGLVQDAFVKYGLHGVLLLLPDDFINATKAMDGLSACVARGRVPCWPSDPGTKKAAADKRWLNSRPQPIQKNPGASSSLFFKTRRAHFDPPAHDRVAPSGG